MSKHTHTEIKNMAKICRDEEQLQLKHDSLCSLSLFIWGLFEEKFPFNFFKAWITHLTSALDLIFAALHLLCAHVQGSPIGKVNSDLELDV